MLVSFLNFLRAWKCGRIAYLSTGNALTEAELGAKATFITVDELPLNSKYGRDKRFQSHTEAMKIPLRQACLGRKNHLIVSVNPK
jgi:hypothetical protein